MLGTIGAPELIVFFIVAVLIVGVVGIVVRLILRATRGAPGPGLMKCVACGRQVSRRAPACPACGEPPGQPGS